MPFIKNRSLPCKGRFCAELRTLTPITCADTSSPHQSSDVNPTFVCLCAPAHVWVIWVMPSMPVGLVQVLKLHSIGLRMANKIADSLSIEKYRM